ncbi:MAG: Rrf2 family transcriptional regulator [Pseudomonadota bacterium]
MIRLSRMSDYAIVILFVMLQSQMHNLSNPATNKPTSKPSSNKTSKQNGNKQSPHHQTNSKPPSTPVSVDQLAKQTGIAVTTTAKLVQKLSSAGFVKAKRGSQGGYFPLVNSKELNLAQIIETIDGPIALTRCSTEHDCSCKSIKICPMRHSWKGINGIIYNILANITFDQIYHNLQSQNPKPYLSLS